MHWFLDPIQNHYTDFSGRATRREYWMFTGEYILVTFVLALLVLALMFLVPSEEFANIIAPLLFGIFGVAIFLPSLAILVRRLHDIGRSGWWALLNLVPYVGGLVLLVFCCLPSEKGTNKYGPNKYETTAPEAVQQEAQPAVAVETTVAE